MPHITIDYTANLSSMLDVEAMVAALHDAAVSSAYFPVGGCRTLARSSTPFRVGDSAPENAFVYINVRILPGRDSEAKQSILRLLSGVAEQQLRPLLETGSIGLQFELSEFDGELTVQRNNMLPASAEGSFRRRA